jgi:hypothetical protein
LGGSALRCLLVFLNRESERLPGSLTSTSSMGPEPFGSELMAEGSRVAAGLASVSENGKLSYSEADLTGQVTATYYQYASSLRIGTPRIWTFLLCRLVRTFYEFINFRSTIEWIRRH